MGYNDRVGSPQGKTGDGSPVQEMYQLRSVWMQKARITMTYTVRMCNDLITRGLEVGSSSAGLTIQGGQP